MTLKTFLFFKDKKKIPKKRSQAESSGLSKILNENYGIKFIVQIISTVFIVFLLTGKMNPSEMSLVAIYKSLTTFLFVSSLFGIMQMYFYYLDRPLFRSNKKQLLIQVIIIITLLVQTLFIRLPFFTRFSYAPYIFAAPSGIMLISLFFGMRTALLFSFFLGMITGAARGMIPESLLLIPVVSAFSAVFMKDVRNRYQITKAGIYTFLLTLFVLISVFAMSGKFDLNQFRDYASGALFTGLMGILFILTLPYILELIFREVTDMTLLELSDMNHKLMKELVLVAPGTYHHSITVANLAEAAAEAIGARSLMVRVMAYYHDIGKLIKPEYFSENESGKKSMHSELSASMSSLIIISHVKNGIDIARRYNLPKAVINGIKEHHGTSLVYYFFKRAQEEQEGKGGVKEENFRYPGPKPQSKETAILSVADTIEAASRSLAEPSPSRIKGLVGDLLKNKYTSGELDECNLTFRELNIIKDVVIRMLTARFHTRPVYPDSKNE